MACHVVDSGSPRVLARPVPGPSLPDLAHYGLTRKVVDALTVAASDVCLEINHIDLTIRIVVRDEEREGRRPVVITGRELPVLNEKPSDLTVNHGFPGEAEAIKVFLVGDGETKIPLETRALTALG